MDFLKELSKKNPERCKAFGHTVQEMPTLFWSTAVAGEVGEMCNFIKKMERGDSGEFTTAIALEAADIVIYLDLLCTKLGIDLLGSIIHKFNQVSLKVKSDIVLYERCKDCGEVLDSTEHLTCTACSTWLDSY